MKVNYDRTALIAGIGVAPWTRLGLERWFPNYKIVSLYDSGVATLRHTPPVLLLGDVRLTKRNTQQMVRTDMFKRLATNELAEYSFLTYKPVEIADGALRNRFIMSRPQYTSSYENKAWLREQFGRQLPFAAYHIYNRTDLRADREQYDRLCRLSLPFVLQHEQLSGGKGTYIVKSYADFIMALSSLPPDGRIVASQHISDARERSVQCCSTRLGTVHGDLQKQIVRSPQLCNLAASVVNGYCGAEIGTVRSSMTVTQSVQRVIDTIGTHMATSGFRGVFGIDFLVRDDELYILEINARLTGVTPLLTMIYQSHGAIPFYLLHALELGGYDYTVDRLQASSNFDSIGSLLLLQSQADQTMTIAATWRSGIYDVLDDGLQFVRSDSRFQNSDSASAIFIQQYVPAGETVRPGGRLIAILTRHAVLDDQDALLPEMKRLVASLYVGIELT
jgi:hypothetical protein